MDIVGLENPADVGLVHGPRTKAGQGDLFVAEGLKKGVRKLLRVKRLACQIRYGLFDFYGVHGIIPFQGRHQTVTQLGRPCNGLYSSQEVIVLTEHGPMLLCGDLHGDIDFAKLANSNVKSFLGADYPPSHVISLGDWGVIWNDSAKSLKQEAYLKGWYNDKPWETLVVQGNHEGYDRISRLPVEERYGAPVRKVSDKVFILEHGHIYTIRGQRFFVFGGGDSIDKAYRTQGVSWWPQEIPGRVDFQRALNNLASDDGQVDWVLTHTCPDSVLDHMIAADLLPFKGLKATDPTVKMLTALEGEIKTAKGWFFGHFHLDFQWKHYRCLYQELFRLPE